MKYLLVINWPDNLQAIPSVVIGNEERINNELMWCNDLIKRYNVTYHIYQTDGYRLIAWLQSNKPL